MTIKRIINSLSNYAQQLFQLEGKPFSLKGRNHLLLPYNHNKKKTLFLFSRQAEKSTTLASKSLARTLLFPYFKTLYIAPREKQVKQFVSQKLSPFAASPVVKQTYIDKHSSTGFFYKTFKNGSDYTLKNVFLSAESARGVSADAIYIDEFQDVIRDHLPVIESSMQHAKKWARFREYAGTPKSLQNHIEYEWRQSYQFEWAIPCNGCNKHNILGVKNIGRDFLICQYCGKQLYPTLGSWVKTNRDGKFPAFRICYLMVPWVVWRNPNDDSEPGVIQMFEDWSEEKFSNEVLAISADSAAIPLTMNELMGACDKHKNWVDFKEYESLVGVPLQARVPKLYAGIDWGTSEENKSSTVLTIGGFFSDGKFRVLFMKKYKRAQISELEEVEDISKHLRKYNVSIIGSDWGFGYIQNAHLNKFFPGKIKLLYSSGSAGEYISFNAKTGLFILSKPLSTARFIYDVKKGNIKFFQWKGNEEEKGFESFASEFMALRSEYDFTNRRIKYFHQVGDPDDCFYSANYCYCAGQIDRQNFIVKHDNSID